MATKLSVLIELKRDLISFLDELIEQFPDEGDFVVLRIFLKDQVPIADVMNIMIQKLIPLADTIRNRDESYFLNNNNLFESLAKDKVSHFKQLWRSGRLDADDRNAIWLWHIRFLNLAEKYQKAN